jgi:hypothetical protein
MYRYTITTEDTHPDIQDMYLNKRPLKWGCSKQRLQQHDLEDMTGESSRPGAAVDGDLTGRTPAAWGGAQGCLLLAERRVDRFDFDA